MKCILYSEMFMPMAAPVMPTLANSEMPTPVDPRMPMMVGGRVLMLTGLRDPALTDTGVAGPEMAGLERRTQTLFQPILCYIFYVFLIGILETTVNQLVH